MTLTVYTVQWVLSFAVLTVEYLKMADVSFIKILLGSILHNTVLSYIFQVSHGIKKCFKL